jgi:acylphosphatase
MVNSTNSRARARIWISGRVQGVGYRAFAQSEGERRGLAGGVRNLDDGRVEVDVEGDREIIDTYLDSLRTGPPIARVTDLEVRWEPPSGRHVGFHIW